MNIGQIYIDTKDIPEGEDYSLNLLPAQVAITSLNIYACPGSKFKINNDKDIIINGTGNYTLQCGSFPILDIRMHKDNIVDMIPTIIDYVRAEG